MAAAYALTARKESFTHKNGRSQLPWLSQTPFDAASLAQAGFAYAAPDSIQCVQCGVRLGHSEVLGAAEQGSDAVALHYTHALKCPLAIILSQAGRCHARPLMPAGKTLEDARHATFVAGGWPHERKRGWVGKSRRMARAGFYYTPDTEAADIATCAYCALALDGWEAKDDPTHEHQRRCPECPIFTGKTPHTEKPASKAQVKRGRSTTRRARKPVVNASPLLSEMERADAELHADQEEADTQHGMESRAETNGSEKAQHSEAPDTNNIQDTAPHALNTEETSTRPAEPETEQNPEHEMSGNASAGTPSETSPNKALKEEENSPGGNTTRALAIQAPDAPHSAALAMCNSKRKSDEAEIESPDAAKRPCLPHTEAASDEEIYDGIDSGDIDDEEDLDLSRKAMYGEAFVRSISSGRSMHESNNLQSIVEEEDEQHASPVSGAELSSPKNAAQDVAESDTGSIENETPELSRCATPSSPAQPEAQLASPPAAATPSSPQKATHAPSSPPRGLQWEPSPNLSSLFLNLSEFITEMGPTGLPPAERDMTVEQWIRFVTARARAELDKELQEKQKHVRQVFFRARKALELLPTK